MAFHVRCDFDRIQSYAQAVKAWREAVIFPKDRKLDNPLLPRGLVNVRKKHLTIERTAAMEDIILRLYHHPVVTWHRDNSFTICSYNTRSTVEFARHCTPIGMWVSGGGYFRVTIDGRTYKTGKQTTFRQRDNTWKPDSITPWSIPVVNRERAKQALAETGYKEFRLWFKVYVQMSARPDGETGWSWINDDAIVTMLRDRKWRDLIACRFPEAWSCPDQVLHKIRQAIYVKYDCIERKSMSFLG